MTKLFLVSFALTAFSCAGLERPLQESCDNYQMDISDELALWEKTSLSKDIFQTVSPPEITGTLPLERKLEMSLTPQDKVKFVVLPEKSFLDSGKSFAGLFFVSVPDSGVYRFFSDSRLWFDVVDGESKKLLSSTGHQMDGRCPMKKVVTFFLNKNQNYILQISSSAKNRAFVLISR